MNTNLKNIKILYVEDEISIQEEIINVLKRISNNILIASNGEEAYHIYKKETPHIILTDICMPKMDGLTFIKEIRKEDFKTAVLFLTAFSDEEKLITAANLNIQGYILKPKVTYKKLKDSIVKAINFLELEEKLIRLKDNLYYNKNIKQLICNDKPILLNKKEIDFIDLLIQYENSIVTYKIIENYIWSENEEIMTGSALRTLVSSLRKKVSIVFIENISKIGYKL